MHFWINKSQGCGFNGRYVPPSISAGTRRNQVPKPMVTPVHRFQSIESVASGGHHHHHHHHHHRHPRAPSYHNANRFVGPGSGSGGVPLSVPNSQTRHHQSRRISIDYVSNGHRGTLTPLNTHGNGPHEGVNRTRAKLKCCVWSLISLVPFMVVVTKFYMNGENGAEVLILFILLIVILLLIGFVSLFEAFSQKQRGNRSGSVQITNDPNETLDDTMGGPPPPLLLTPTHCGELPPPPYHIAVMLPTQNDRLTIIQDSPPPTYEKAVT